MKLIRLFIHDDYSNTIIEATCDYFDVSSIGTSFLCKELIIVDKEKAGDMVREKSLSIELGDAGDYHLSFKPTNGSRTYSLSNDTGPDYIPKTKLT
jgi:hypothetical protein